MPSLTVDNFKIGLDSRKGPSVADADRLLDLTNAYINSGKVPRKRAGSTKDVTLEAGSVGIMAADDKLNTFYGKGTLTHADPDYVANLLNATIEHGIFTGSGLDDMTSQGEFTDISAANFDVEVDGTGTPNTFKWRKNGGTYTTGVNMTGTPQDLSDGVQVVFAATTGHTLTDVWSFNCNFYSSILKIHFADVFLGFIYVSAEYNTGLIRHHYLDGSVNTLIKDVNCPNTAGVIKMEEKIWAVNGDTVNFSKNRRS